MTPEEKKHLLKSLTDSHSGLRATIETFDPETQIYSETGWRIRDIISHITTWIREVEKSLRAHQTGTEYVINNLDEDAFNEQSVKVQQDLNAVQVYLEWEQAFEEVKKALDETPLELFPGDLLPPWGNERGTIAGLVEFLIDHDAEHREEILKAVKAN